MRNTRDIEGAPRLLDALDVNNQDLVNLYMLYGRPTLGVTLDVNRQDLVHVSRVAAHPSDSIIMDSVTQFNDDVNINGQVPRRPRCVPFGFAAAGVCVLTTTHCPHTRLVTAGHGERWPDQGCADHGRHAEHGGAAAGQRSRGPR